jgi:hypothetical protein
LGRVEKRELIFSFGKFSQLGDICHKIHVFEVFLPFENIKIKIKVAIAKLQ